jgi:hypothetical protein
MILNRKMTLEVWMKVRTDVRAGQAPALDPQQLAQWVQAQMQSPGAPVGLAPAQLLQLAQNPLDVQALSSALQSAAGPLHPQQFLSLVGRVQGFLESPQGFFSNGAQGR